MAGREIYDQLLILSLSISSRFSEGQILKRKGNGLGGCHCLIKGNIAVHQKAHTSL